MADEIKKPAIIIQMHPHMQDFSMYGTDDFNGAKKIWDAGIPEGSQKIGNHERMSLRGYLGEHCQLIIAQVNLIEGVIPSDFGEAYKHPGEILENSGLTDKDVIEFVRDNYGLILQDIGHYLDIEGQEDVPDAENRCAARPTTTMSFPH